MTERITFQIRARTIDHLGRGQIADAYTAISELWKNAYDAYATEVSLNIVEGNPSFASIIDNGHGMTYQDFTDRWLIIGTESKLENVKTSREDRFNLTKRQRQGEKGIGRLSAAFLSPLTLIVSKKQGHPYAAALVDWRLFENPFIILTDIGMAVEEFDSLKELPDLIPSMLNRIKENLTGEYGSRNRTRRLRAAWTLFADIKTPTGTGSEIHNYIKDSHIDFDYLETQFQHWEESFTSEEPHGTLLLSLGINRELDFWLQSSVAEDDEAAAAKRRLYQTLVAFTDPYSETKIEFDYSVHIYKNDRWSQLISSEQVFDIFNLRALEHTIEGEFDHNGHFEANVRCYGEDRGIKSLNTARPSAFKHRGKLGPIQVCIGTFEPELNSTTHSVSEHAILVKQVKESGGIYVYRDGLRVLPYGRVDADFFDIEARRGLNAGLYFWAHKRVFGRVAFSRKNNPHLLDKAGREGLIDNRASRELKLNVVNVLVEFANRFFGRTSDYRKELLPIIQSKNISAQKAAENAKKKRRLNLNKFLKDNNKHILEISETARRIQEELLVAVDRHDIDTVQKLSQQSDSLEIKRNELRLSAQPPKNKDLEKRYRQYRDSYNELCATLESIQKALSQFIEENLKDCANDQVQSFFYSRQSMLSSKVGNNLKRIKVLVNDISDNWITQADEDNSAYYKKAHCFLDDLETGTDPVTAMNLLDREYHTLNDETTLRYDGIIRSLEQIKDEIDLDGALGYVQFEEEELRQKVTQLNSLAQLGISVEIIGHELETIDQEISRNLRRLPNIVKETSAYKIIMSSHKFLVNRLRFLTPMKVSGQQLRETISGKDIEKYLLEFFGKNISSSRVNFIVTDRFRSFLIEDYYSRIYPTFINLINNSLYWLNFAKERIITLDCKDDEVIIADSGPGVDEDDINTLFTLFFTRRAQGRGVGLYLCRENLAASEHTIRYISNEDEKILPGANFAINFQDIAYDL
ncbi:MAG: histidine kinase [Desulfotalea sp.]|nr:MAG: histidine kinase [Desulfotalea sp.]